MVPAETSQLSFVSKVLQDLLRGKFSEEDFMTDESESAEIAEIFQLVKELADHHKELKQIVSSLSKGNLKVDIPSSNFVASPLRELQSSLLRLSDQTKILAKGNYEQDIDRFGDLSFSINSLRQFLFDKELLEKAYKENREQMRMILDLIPYGIIWVRISDYQLIYMNPKAYEIFGIQQYDNINLNILMNFSNQDDQNYFKESILNNNFVREWEVVLKKGNDQEFWGLISAAETSYKDDRNLLIGVVDISERKILDEERLRLLEEVDISRQQIEEEAVRMMELNVQLEESEQKLQELNVSKDKLFSIIGHDLKNPMFVIKSYAEILNEDYAELSDQEKHDIIRSIGDTSKHAQTLLEDLLQWARSQSGRIEYNPEPIALKSTINNAIGLIASQAEKKNIQLSAEINFSFVVNADKRMLDTVLRNLISNAVKFTNVGGTVKVLAAEKDGFVQIAVVDSGIGLSEADRNKLFRIDVKNCEIGKSKEKGTGLGLILCKEFVEHHGGNIWVESEIEKGSRFNFTIPKI